MTKFSKYLDKIRSPKMKLIDILREIQDENYDQKKIEQFKKIICKLELFQNSI